MSTYEARLTALREQLKRDRVDGFVVPLTDEHMSEYVGDYAARLGWLTGFQGSAGSAVVLPEEAAIFIDGRYTLQVREQVDAAHWSYVAVPDTSIAAWLGEHAPAGARIGYDPWLHTRSWVKQARGALAAKGAELVAVDTNPIDAVWPDRPAPSDARLVAYDNELAGRSSADKRHQIADWLSEQGADAVVLAALDSIAWTFNVRGQDVAHTPVALAYAVIRKDATADLYVAPDKMSEAVAQHLGNGVRIHDRADFAAALGGFEGERVVADPGFAVAAIFDGLAAGGAEVIATRDPTVLAKAIKNPAEIAGQKAAQARDGVAMSRFLRWLEREAPRGRLTELDVVKKLAKFRQETGALVDQSFSTISAAGPHAAIPHYHSTAESNLPLEKDRIFLVDSGAQYLDGTTDITRTVIVGTPTAEMRDRFTRVLKGHIGLASAIFPHGTTGGELDSFARQYLWAAGLDFAHGTGHGVGAYLSVHEGPQRIAKPSYPGGGPGEPLRAGMILSNEPGYYKAGEYGIRIENLVLVVDREIEGGDQPMLGFETLTFAPIDRRLIDGAMLSAGEQAWMDAYHAQVLAIVGPQLEGEEKAWLERSCAPLG